MNNEELLNMEYDNNVSYDNKKFDVVLSINNEELAFQKEKGLFRKKLKVVDRIPVKEIKIVRNKAKIKLRRNNLIAYTKNGTCIFYAKSFVEGKKIINAVMNVLYGKGLLMRTADKSLKVAEDASSFFKRAAGVGVVVGGGYAALNKNKKSLVALAKDIKKFGKTIISIIKK